MVLFSLGVMAAGRGTAAACCHCGKDGCSPTWTGSRIEAFSGSLPGYFRRFSSARTFVTRRGPPHRDRAP